MELKDFVSETLTQVAAGVKAAHSEIQPTGASIVPGFESVEFDIAVTVSENTGHKAKAGISVFSVGAGAERAKESAASTVNRIKFAVKLYLPKDGKRRPLGSLQGDCIARDD